MYFVGIDIGKRHHQAVIIDQQGERWGSTLGFSNDRPGMEMIMERLESLDEPFRIALEASGQYWLCLHNQLSSHGCDVTTVNPIQINAYRKTGIRKTKTDPVDAFWIADFLRIGRARPSQIPESTRLRLRELSRFRFGLVDRIGDLKRKVRSVLDRVFPEYESLFSSIFLKSSRRLLEKAVSASEFADLDLSELTQILREASRGRFGQRKAQQIIDQAKNSIGVPFLADAARIEVQCLLEQIKSLEQQIEMIDEHLATLLEETDQYLTTIPGIGAVLAAAILGEIGDVSRFAELKNLVAYAGIDPTVHESGQFGATRTHMSKRGSPYLRRALWLAANVARLHDPDLKAYYHKKKQEGKHHNAIIGALCRKPLARIYVILQEKRPYVVR
jgi:transposase